MGLFSKKSTYDPMSQYTPEQQKSIQALMSLASTGSGGGITLGEKYSGALGAYDMTDQSKQGLAALQGLLGGAYDPNSDMGQARSTYQNLANNSIFDLESDQSGYKAFNKALTKAGKESSDVLNREAAMTGTRFGTAIGAQKADLAENLQLQRAQQLANLYQGSQQVAALGAQGLTGLADQVAQLSGLNVTYGDMQRQMENAKAKDQYAEFQRTRGEELSRLNLMQNQQQNPLGTISISQPSAFGKLASGILQAGGAAIGGAFGKPQLGAQVGGAFGDYLTGPTTMNGIPVGGGSSFGGFSTGSLSELGSMFSGFSSGNQSGTGLFGSKLGGQTQSEILGFNTANYRSS